MSIMEGGESTVIPNSEGARTTPSVVAFAKNGERLVGQAAKRQAVTNPQNTIFSAKRLIGRKFSEIQDEASSLPYQVVEGKNGDAYIEVEVNGERKQYAPEQISAMVLSKLKADAEDYLGEKITKAVITVPAYFNEPQREATKDAGTIAGLEVVRIINEPTAASLAYGLNKKGDKTIAVYDLGGGTFDISMLNIADDVFEVEATNGDTHLGGDNWDSRIIDWLVDTFKSENGIDLRSDPMALQRLKEEAEKAKIALSSTQNVDINLPFITADASGPKHMNVALSRSKFEQLTEDLFNRTKEPFMQCMKDAELSREGIDDLVLVGGMPRTPKVSEIAKELTGKDPHKGVNPDEVVAIGAAIQAAVLSGDSNVGDVLLLDVTPLSLGIETAGGVMTAMIEKNTTIPKKHSQVFSTFADNQTAVDIKVLQGERPMADDNKMLGNFRLDGIEPAPRGIPQIEVTFDIDANGILHVTAVDKKTGKDQKITISGSSGLDKEEVEKMKEEAELHAEEDKQRKSAVEARNNLDNLVYQAEKQLGEMGEQIPADAKSQVEGVIAETKKVLENQNATAEELKTAADGLTAALQKLAGAAQQPGESTQGGPEGPTDGGEASSSSNGETKAKSDDDDVVDADFEVVDDDDKK
mgnify:CR=1 FL=1